MGKHRRCLKVKAMAHLVANTRPIVATAFFFFLAKVLSSWVIPRFFLLFLLLSHWTINNLFLYQSPHPTIAKLHNEPQCSPLSWFKEITEIRYDGWFMSKFAQHHEKEWHYLLGQIKCDDCNLHVVEYKHGNSSVYIFIVRKSAPITHRMRDSCDGTKCLKNRHNASIARGFRVQAKTISLSSICVSLFFFNHKRRPIDKYEGPMASCARGLSWSGRLCTIPDFPLCFLLTIYS